MCRSWRKLRVLWVPIGDREKVGGDRTSRRGIKIAQIKGRWTYGPYVMRVGSPAISLDIARRVKLPRNNGSVENDRAPLPIQLTKKS